MPQQITTKDIREYVAARSQSGLGMTILKTRIGRDGRIMTYGYPRRSTKRRWFFFAMRDDIARNITLTRAENGR